MKRTEQKVYVLTTQCSLDYEQGSDVGVYATKELAQKEMKRDYENMCEEYPDWVGSIDDDCAEMQEEGEYTRNHCDWQIKEMKVITEQKTRIMEKALVLLFSVDDFNVVELDDMSNEQRYTLAKENVSNGSTDIYTLGEFCGDLNNEDLVMENWFAYPHYVDEDEYEEW